MTDERDNALWQRADALVPPCSDDASQTSTDSRALLVHALSEDLQTHVNHQVADEARLVKIELRRTAWRKQ